MLNSPQNKTSTKPSLSRPFINYKGLAVVCNPMTYPTVLRLLLSGGPAVIFRSVITHAVSALSTPVTPVVVWALNTMTRRGTRPYIFVESGETVTPAFASDNTSTTVIFIGRTLNVVTPKQNRRPRSVFRRICHSVNQSSFSTDQYLSQQAATRSRLSLQCPMFNCYRTATHALTVPRTTVLVLLSRSFPEHGQPSKYLSCQINKLTICFSHVVRSFLANKLVRACDARQRFVGLFYFSMEIVV